MRYHVLAVDYDGTLATEGRVAPSTVEALRRLAESGRRLVLVTGRHLPDLRRVFPELELFDRVVAENGGTLWTPGGEERALAPAPPPAFLEELRARGVPFDAGRVVVATWTPHEVEVVQAIGRLGLELQVVFNKGAVMVLPPGVHKGTGLLAALGELGLTPHEVVAVGDAENDHAMLAAAECGVAVENALPAVKATADVVTHGARGAGVEEIAAALVRDDLALADPPRRHLLLGQGREGPVALPPSGARLLVAGPSGGGKTTAASGVLERLRDAGYQVCLVDPEGDYEAFAGFAALGTADRPPEVEEVLALLRSDPRTSPAVSLLGLPMAERPRFFAALLPRLQALRAETGRPHWIALDEAHHLLPRAWQPAPDALPADPGRLLLVTLDPARLAPAVLDQVTALLAVGEAPARTVEAFLDASGRPRPPAWPQAGLGEGEALCWRTLPGGGDALLALRPEAPRAAHRRHRRKYATGDVREKAFLFRGADGRLHLRAQNLSLFLQLAEGVDDATWLHHLRQGDYSRWFREAIKDEALAREAAEVERAGGGDAGATRRRIREAVERRYVVGD